MSRTQACSYHRMGADNTLPRERVRVSGTGGTIHGKGVLDRSNYKEKLVVMWTVVITMVIVTVRVMVEQAVGL